MKRQGDLSHYASACEFCAKRLDMHGGIYCLDCAECCRALYESSPPGPRREAMAAHLRKYAKVDLPWLDLLGSA